MTKYALIAALVATVSAGGYAIYLQRSNASLKAENSDLRDYATTMERIADAPPVDLDDPDAVRLGLCALAGIDPCLMPGD